MNDETKQGKYFDFFLKLIALSGPACLALGVMYDFGYYYSLGLSFRDVPTSLTDHLRNTIDWLPYLFLTMTGAYVVELITQRIERGKTEEEIVNATAFPAAMRKFRESPKKFFKFLLPIAILNNLLVGDANFGDSKYLFAIGWYFFAKWLNSPPLIKMRRPEPLRVLLCWAPAIAIFVGLHGYDQGLLDIKSKTYPSEINFQSGNLTVIKAKILKAHERGILYLSPHVPGVSFAKWDNVNRIIMDKKSPGPFKGLLCWWNVYCSKVYSSE